MRIIVLTLLLSFGAAAAGSAQEQPTGTGTTAEAGLATGLIPEPRPMTKAIDFASSLMGDEGSTLKDGFYRSSAAFSRAGGCSQPARVTADISSTDTPWLTHPRPSPCGRTSWRKRDSS